MRKIPPWAWALIAVGAGVAFYLYKKHKEAQEVEASESTSSDTQQSAAVSSEEIPYSPGEYSSGGGGIGGPIAGANESQQEFHELFGQQQTFEKEFLTSDQESQKSIAEQIRTSEEAIRQQLEAASKGSTGTTTGAGSGGGAPSSPPPGGVTTAPPPPTQSKPETVENITCPNGCPGHRYHPSGRTECMTKYPTAKTPANPKGLKCEWPH